jgi:hypothetical protein
VRSNRTKVQWLGYKSEHVDYERELGAIWELIRI